MDKELQKFSYAYLRSRTKLAMVCVYAHPDDYPNLYVARLWDVKTPTNLVVTGKSLEEVRRAKPPEMVIMARNAEDDPAIMEIWI